MNAKEIEQYIDDYLKSSQVKVDRWLIANDILKELVKRSHPEIYNKINVEIGKKFGNRITFTFKSLKFHILLKGSKVLVNNSVSVFLNTAISIEEEKLVKSLSTAIIGEIVGNIARTIFLKVLGTNPYGFVISVVSSVLIGNWINDWVTHKWNLISGTYKSEYTFRDATKKLRYELSTLKKKFINSNDIERINSIDKELKRRADFDKKYIIIPKNNTEGHLKEDLFEIYNVSLMDAKEQIMHFIDKIEIDSNDDALHYMEEEEQLYKLNDYELEIALENQMKRLISLLIEKTELENSKEKKNLTFIKLQLGKQKRFLNVLKSIKKSKLESIEDKITANKKEIKGINVKDYKRYLSSIDNHSNYLKNKRKALKIRLENKNLSILERINTKEGINAIDVALSGGDGAKALNISSRSSNFLIYTRMSGLNYSRDQKKKIEHIYAMKEALKMFNYKGFKLNKDETYIQQVTNTANKNEKSFVSDVLRDSEIKLNTDENEDKAEKVSNFEFWKGKKIRKYSTNVLLHNPKILFDRSKRMDIEKRIREENEKEYQDYSFVNSNENYKEIKDLDFDIRMLVNKFENINILLNHINYKEIHIDNNNKYKKSKLNKKIDEKSIISNVYFYDANFSDKRLGL